ncbi:hypothetical protein J2797_005576 [Paraburkholderia terricola]|uniref:dsDNA nuclease domain-containing protein n=1 Tax=Paraburkholderia terricola TaxID=169427 RepID=UPI00285AE079|nr:dsDNA nuclease domain-containing protein [Paraburkholderia terricola]MDR6495652.1 hypothetical protein [Paraburkholderia terricola]
MKLHEIKPREQSGRDTFARYKAQTRAAAIAALAILEASGVDRVYCDYHDDFVIRSTSVGTVRYRFVQVKTKKKQNENWAVNEVFGLKASIRNQDKQDSDAIRESFAGKLFCHTVNFFDTCDHIALLTNINFENRIEAMLADIQLGSFSDPLVAELAKRFNTCFPYAARELTELEVRTLMAKLVIEPDVEYVKEKEEAFFPFAREKIHEYSEIDLNRHETREIALDLLALVEQRSAGAIVDFSEENIDRKASIGIRDLLEILAISYDAYESLRSGGDQKAIKTASVIQRVLVAAGATSDEVEVCARCKTGWDVWLRANRNVINEINLLALTAEVEQVFRTLILNFGDFRVSKLRLHVLSLRQRLTAEGLIFDLKDEHLLGALLAVLVRFKS